MKDNKIAAVVVTYNRLELLKECVQSLRDQTRQLDEIIVVNNSSSDGTLEWLNEQNDMTVITQENSGSAGGQYTGIKTAYVKGYDWVWCFDSDVTPDINALDSFLSSKEFEMQNVGFLSSLVYDQNKNISYINIPYLPRERDLVFNFLKEGTFPIISSSFGSVLINRKAIERVGYPNPAFFIWGDDVDYTFRIIESGFKGYLIRESVAIHHHLKNSENAFENIETQDIKFKYAVVNVTYCILYRNRVLKRNPLANIVSAIKLLSDIQKSRREIKIKDTFYIAYLWLLGIIKYVKRY
jgi:GT2 family glycosyltransferase